MNPDGPGCGRRGSAGEWLLNHDRSSLEARKRRGLYIKGPRRVFLRQTRNIGAGRADFTGVGNLQNGNFYVSRVARKALSLRNRFFSPRSRTEGHGGGRRREDAGTSGRSFEPRITRKNMDDEAMMAGGAKGEDLDGCCAKCARFAQQV
jgi:hypothetical protein